MLGVGSPALPVAPLQIKGVLCWVFPRATRPACLPRVSCSTLGVFCETGHILSCDGGALVLCSHAGSRFELCISSHAMGDAGSCFCLVVLINCIFLYVHFYICWHLWGPPRPALAPPAPPVRCLTMRSREMIFQFTVYVMRSQGA